MCINHEKNRRKGSSFDFTRKAAVLLSANSYKFILVCRIWIGSGSRQGKTVPKKGLKMNFIPGRACKSEVSLRFFLSVIVVVKKTLVLIRIRLLTAMVPN
jgi:hypothetical protein